MTGAIDTRAELTQRIHSEGDRYAQLHIRQEAQDQWRIILLDFSRSDMVPPVQAGRQEVEPPSEYFNCL